MSFIPPLSDMERGKIDVDSTSLAMLAEVLRKPISYFFPQRMYRELKKEDLDPLQEEALLHFREIRGENLQRLAIQVLRTFRNYDPKDLVIELIPYVQERLRREEAVKEVAEKRRKRKPQGKA